MLTKHLFFLLNHKALAGDLTGLTKEFHHDEERIGNILAIALNLLGWIMSVFGTVQKRSGLSDTITDAMA